MNIKIQSDTHVTLHKADKRFPKGRIHYQKMQSKSKMGKRWVWVYKPWTCTIEPRMESVVGDGVCESVINDLLQSDSYKLL